MRRRYENDIKLYEYVINSNCIGGTILVDGKNVGTVSSSPLIYITPKTIISSISISGGVPPDNRELIDSYIENKTEIKGVEALGLKVERNNVNPRVLDIRWVYGPFYRVSTPITYKKYKIYHNHAPYAIYNVSPGVYNLDYIYETAQETIETPGSAVQNQIVPYNSIWYLNFVGGNVDHMGQSGIDYSITQLVNVGISSPIQDDSYIVIEGDLRLRLRMVEIGEDLDEIPVKQQVRYEFK